MVPTTVFDIVFAAGVVVAVVALAGAALRFLPRRALLASAGVELAAAAAAWIAFALTTKHDTELAVAAAGLTVCTIVADEDTGLLRGGADPRRPSYALGL